jgi:hypothetical protein
MSVPNDDNPPDHFAVGGDLDWKAPFVHLSLWVELPFWLMVSNSTMSIRLRDHDFQVAVHDEYFELHGNVVTDSRRSVCYRGPFKKLENLSEAIQEVRRANPELPLMWRKCKTVVKIATRCNEQIWAAATGSLKLHDSTIRFYLQALCQAHIPVLNRLVQSYRLATYDYFAFEVAPWDVPHWMVEREAKSVLSELVPYRSWDTKPIRTEPHGETFGAQFSPTNPPSFYQLIREDELREQVATAVATSGEFELLDAQNLMERGDYSGAVRRITTAIEVIVEALVGEEIKRKEGEKSAARFLKETATNFNRRLKKYQTISGRVLPDVLFKELGTTRKLRHRIVHGGYRIDASERGTAQRSIDTGRWIFNWLENDGERQKVREKRIAFRSLGRDLTFGVFPTDITPEGVVVFPLR